MLLRFPVFFLRLFSAWQDSQEYCLDGIFLKAFGRNFLPFLMNSWYFQSQVFVKKEELRLEKHFFLQQFLDFLQKDILLLSSVLFFFHCLSHRCLWHPLTDSPACHTVPQFNYKGMSYELQFYCRLANLVN